ncbi:auxin response factor 17-like [Arachis ipaensis]|uniref:auxin response factor 17-like n=1 Tax=Arachis ipaensis TaxID=130454 RepID=UPI0007AF4BEA|nr:auxin response factor 17-like [Arachis ipaensis]
MPRRSAPSSSLPPRPTPIPAKFWRACAGISAQAPVVNSRVYYFPQGHIDQAASQPRNLSPLVYSRPVIPCRVSAVNYFADPNTDEVFLKILLLPVTDGSAQDFLPPAVAAEGNSGNGNGDDEEVASYAKILTRSDANNGGGFSVPRSCADLVFPPLNFEEDPPVQNLRITDLHGAVWEFRHIHRGTPRRHLFTSGWSKFVNSKKIISGDTVVFMKDSDGRMFVGLRRNMSLDDDISDGGLDWCEAIVGMDAGKEEKEEKEEEEVMTEGFARNGKGRVTSTSVAEAMELAAQNKPFEVVYYPSVGWGEFVVKAEDVDAMINGIPWSVGMRVKMGRENYDSSRMDWFQGTVSGVTVPGKDQPWSGSPWRMLQITWDESEILKNVNPVSPWQVELLSETLLLPQIFLPTKRFRTTDGSGVFINEMGESSSSISRFSIPDSTMGLLNQTLLSNYDTLFSASMQGARHPLFSAATYPLFPIDPSLSIDSSFENNIVPKLNVMLPKLNIDTHKPKNLSPHSKSSLTPIDETPNTNSTKSGATSFQLFGCTIQTDQASDKIDDHNNVEGEDNIQ